MEKNLLIPYKQLFLFVLGGSLYYMIEILFVSGQKQIEPATKP